MTKYEHTPRKAVRLDPESDNILAQMKMLSGTNRDTLVNNAIKIAYGSVAALDKNQMAAIQRILQNVLSSFFRDERL